MPNPDLIYIGQLVIYAIAIIAFARLGEIIIRALNGNVTPETIEKVGASLRQVADMTFTISEDHAKTTETLVDDAVLAVIRRVVFEELNKHIPTGSTVIPPQSASTPEGVG